MVFSYFSRNEVKFKWILLRLFPLYYYWFENNKQNMATSLVRTSSQEGHEHIKNAKEVMPRKTLFMFKFADI